MNRPISLKKSALVVVLMSALGSAIMVYLDAFDKFYELSRQFEYFHFDEIVVFMAFFLLAGTLCISLIMYRMAVKHSEHLHHYEKILLDEYYHSEADPVTNPLEYLRLNFRKSPFLLALSLILIIGLVEIFDMILLDLLKPMPFHWEVIADATILIAITTPAMYFIFFRPMQRQFIIREKTEQALSQCNLQLEDRIKKRTAALDAECAERKRAEEHLREHQKQLRAMSSELALVEERERRRIATDLHDNVGHNLALLKNQLTMLRASVATDQDRLLLENINNLLDESIEYSRKLIFELSSPLLDYLDFQSAIEWLAEEILGSNQIKVNMTIQNPVQPLRDELRMLILKSIRELLVNIVKHANAMNVHIRVHSKAEGITVEIDDDGVGFEVPSELMSLSRKSGLGLFSIHERLAGLDGHLAINSEPGQGTCMILTVPVSKEKAEAYHEEDPAGRRSSALS